MAADLSRRSLLGLGVAAIVGGLAACGPPAATSPRRSNPGGFHGGATGAETGSADAAPLADAAAGERRLIEAYDAIVPLAAGPDRRLLRRLRAQHAAHLSRLVPATGASGSSGTSGGSGGSGAFTRRPDTAARVGRLENGSAHRLARSAVTTDGATAALLASIAASHAAHAELIRGVRLPDPASGRHIRRKARRRP